MYVCVSGFQRVKAKIYGVSKINPALSLLMKHLVIGQCQKAPNFSGFIDWSLHSSLVSIRNHEGRTFTEMDRNKLLRFGFDYHRNM